VAGEQSQAAPDKLDRETLLVASVVVIGAIMSILDATIANVALATLRARGSAPAAAPAGAPQLA
jgi:hypothetical protein